MDIGDEPGDEVTFQGRDDGCGVYSIGTREEVVRATAQHFFAFHQKVGTFVEGVHFTIEEHPLTCDICVVPVEAPYWQHTCSPPLTEDDTDGQWLLCDTCHDLVRTWTAEAAEAMAERAIAGILTLSPGLTQEPIAVAALTTATRERVAVLMVRLDPGTRIEVGAAR